MGELNQKSGAVWKLQPNIDIAAAKLPVHEMYFSVQGEASHAGWPCLFLRTSGCNLRCNWCDTPEAFAKGDGQKLSSILEEIAGYPTKVIQLTGGEPLLHKAVYPLMQVLVTNGYTVLLETGGSLPISQVPAGVKIILDVKCPGSGEESRNHWPNLKNAPADTEYKFVIKDRTDFDYLIEVAGEYSLYNKGTVWASPVFGVLDPKELVEWIKDSGQNIRLNLQIHKYIWGDHCTGV